ncbi:hypothetical protein GOP47_0022427 [Adiantum capillus-veneris]|uniref:MI domain-containing protein n=1 Tax=Adiantum capillus-veneris TaxID=13818 RepID=A0A9D4U5J4_ADICA|nr:hypothetical protein GOP47_0022427 [Adiantum capillus-veneris]
MVLLVIHTLKYSMLQGLKEILFQSTHTKGVVWLQGVDIKVSKPGVERIRYTRDFLYSLKDVFTRLSQEIRDAVLDIESELGVSEESERSRPAIQAQSLPSTSRFLEADNRDWKAKPVADDRAQERPSKETGKKSDTDWRVNKEPERNGSVLKLPYQQEHLLPQFSSRQHEPQYSRQPEPQHTRQQESHLYTRQQDSRQQEPHYPRHQEPLYQRQQDFAPLSVDAAGLSPGILRAPNPWMARRGAISEKERVLRTVKGILNKLTPEKFGVLVEQLLNAGIDSAEILKGVISLVFDKAVLEPTFCPLYAELCVHLSKALPEFPCDEEDGKPVTFRRILLNSCQEAFEGADSMQNEIRQLTKPEQEVERSEKEKLVKLRTLGNIKLIGELFKQKMIPEKIVHYCIRMLLGFDPKTPPAEENIEALCQLLRTVGKQLEESNKSTKVLEVYFSQLKEYCTSSRLPSRIRFLILNTIDLRANKWVPRREEVKAKTLHEIHAEAEKTLGLRPGVMGMRNGWGGLGVMGLPGLGNHFTPVRPGSMMPGMPGLLPVTGMMPGPAPLLPGYFPGVDPEGWQYSVARRNAMGRQGLIPPPTLAPGGPYGMPLAGMRPNVAANTRFPSQGNGVAFMATPSALLGDAFGRPVMNAPPPSLRQGPYNAQSDVTLKSSVKSVERVEALSKQTIIGNAVPSAVLQKKTESLFEEFFSLGDLDEALLCVQDLKSPEYNPQLVQIGVTMALDSTDQGRELISKLFEFLCSKKVLSQGDVRAGIRMVAEQLEDLALDIPMAPKYIGDLVGKASLAGVAELGILVDIIQRIEDPLLKRSVYDAALKTIKLGPNSERLLTQRSKFQECERLVQTGTK